MNRTVIVLYVIILGLIVNLGANMIWKYIPDIGSNLDKVVTAVLIVISILLLIYVKQSPIEGSKRHESAADHHDQIFEQRKTGNASIGDENENIMVLNAGRDISISQTSLAVAPQDAYLRFQITKTSWMNFDMDENGTCKYFQEYGRLFEFSIANPSDRLAVVDRIYVHVLEVLPDDWGGPEGQAQRYKYELRLDPKRSGEYTIAEAFKYSAGEVDVFSLNLKTTQFGYEYFFRICADWYDADSGERHFLESDVLSARFPANHQQSGDRSLRVASIDEILEVSKKKVVSAREHAVRLEEMRKKFSNTQTKSEY